MRRLSRRGRRNGAAVCKIAALQSLLLFLPSLCAAVGVVAVCCTVQHNVPSLGLTHPATTPVAGPMCVPNDRPLSGLPYIPPRVAILRSHIPRYVYDGLIPLELTFAAQHTHTHTHTHNSGNPPPLPPHTFPKTYTCAPPAAHFHTVLSLRSKRLAPFPVWGCVWERGLRPLQKETGKKKKREKKTEETL